MELKTKTGNLVENLEKCLNDDIHELQDCRISKHTVNHSVYIINPLCSEQNFIIHFSWFFWKIYLNFKNSKMCLHQVKLSVLNKWTPYVSARHRRWAWHSSKLPINLKVLQLLYGSPVDFDSENWHGTQRDVWISKGDDDKWISSILWKIERKSGLRRPIHCKV